jgi:uncharacterized SAM-binding protein YcdF (DUF218 family)
MNEHFVYLSKIIWTVISPDSIFIILLTLCLLLFLLKQTKTATFLLFLLTFCILFLSIFSVGDWLLYPLESRFQKNPDLPEHVDGIIVLGGSIIPDRSVEWEQLETNQFHERLSNFIQLAQIYSNARLVFSGGNSSTDVNKPTEAQIAKTFFLKSGISPERLLIENKARNTAENASYSKQLARPESNETWILITTAFHMPRAMGVFCQQNWRVLASHEWLGLFAYYLTGKTHQLLPAQCDYSN